MEHPDPTETIRAALVVRLEQLAQQIRTSDRSGYEPDVDDIWQRVLQLSALVRETFA